MWLATQYDHSVIKTVKQQAAISLLKQGFQFTKTRRETIGPVRKRKRNETSPKKETHTQSFLLLFYTQIKSKLNLL